jgi:hypothetical protein
MITGSQVRFEERVDYVFLQIMKDISTGVEIQNKRGFPASSKACFAEGMVRVG